MMHMYCQKLLYKECAKCASEHIQRLYHCLDEMKNESRESLRTILKIYVLFIKITHNTVAGLHSPAFYRTMYTQ